MRSICNCSENRTTHDEIDSRFADRLLAALAAASSLTACAPLLIGGAVVGGAMMATDRRTSGAQVEDQAIELKAMNRAARSRSATAATSTSTSYNRMVLLTGEVPTEADKAAVEQAVQRGSRTCARSSTNWR